MLTSRLQQGGRDCPPRGSCQGVLCHREVPVCEGSQSGCTGQGAAPLREREREREERERLVGEETRKREKEGRERERGGREGGLSGREKETSSLHTCCNYECHNTHVLYVIENRSALCINKMILCYHRLAALLCTWQQEEATMTQSSTSVSKAAVLTCKTM